MSEAGYLRQPTISGEAIVFVCDDDLWRVDAAGGLARRLTAGLGEPSNPALSPDGRWLAYVARDEQHPEVYLMPGEGGAARRMTWLGPDVMVRGFTPDGRILFVTTHGQPFFRNYRAYALTIEGGLPELLPLGQVNHLSFGTGGARVLGRNTADPARWSDWRGTSPARCGSAIASSISPMRRASAICIRAVPTGRTCAVTPTTMIFMRVMRQPTGGASSINAAPGYGSSIRPTTWHVK
jgi:tricorn protease-like protein